MIALEGIDGSGKSTQAGLLSEALRARGREVVATREPGGTPLGERLRDVLLTAEPGGIGALAEAHLFAAARAELVETVIRPALDDGKWVVTDRFLDSSLAYQGQARGLGVDAVLALNAAVAERCVADLALVIDTPLEVAAARRCAGPDRIEAEGDGFQQRVADGYRELARRFPERVRLVAADGDPQSTHRAVLAEVDALA